ncbi:MAG TPA: winged helix-turn-helix domain-containing protein [Solirubrobacteraceae bacterium]|nr:winged helix-turn-helix domain-containing protein [Solirubrobacteraceae bacterium]
MRYTLRAGVPAPGPDSTPGGHVRAAVLAALDDRDLTGPEIAAEVGRPLGTVMFHVQSLLLAGLIDEVPDEEVLLKDL